MSPRFPNLTNLLRLIVGLLISWVLIHVLGVFGVFLAIAYPIWWLVAPSQLPCVGCQLGREGTTCKVCGRLSIKHDQSVAMGIIPVFKHVFLLLVLTMLSLVVLYGESRIIKMALGQSTAQKTVSFLIPSKNQHRLHEVFPLEIQLSGIVAPINAVQADLRFDPTHLEAVGISVANSFATVFVQKDINNSMGYVRISGGVPNPGYKSESGLFATIYFRSKTVGVTELEYLPTTLILANDGEGTNVLKELATFSFLTVPESISEVELQHQNRFIENLNVLGEKTGGATLLLYATGTPVVTQTPSPTQSAPKTEATEHNFVERIADFDQFVLEQWLRLLKPEE